MTHLLTCGRAALRRTRRFFRREDGNASVEFVLLFPAIWMLFGMTLEAGMYTMQEVMLERGLDMTVRDVRLGLMENPDHDKLVDQTCDYALILANCESSLRVEMIKADARAWIAPGSAIPCINREEEGNTAFDINNGKNNELMVLRVCVLIKPLLPFATVGRSLIENSTSGEYPLVATSSYVMEPFK